MMLKEKICYFWTVFCLVTSKTPRVPFITDKSFIDECVQSHNEFRSRVDPPAADMKQMSWSASLAKVAKNWANQCRFEHNGCLSTPYACDSNYQFLGENIWMGTANIFSPKSAIEAWYNETEHFTFDNLQCTEVCGHYTQVVWAASNRVGCAVSTCSSTNSLNNLIFVCNYGPAGNFQGTHPYTKGAPCSLCETGDTCIKRLCIFKEQQNLKV
ncbi:GLIPR1-like protein 1 [Suncus etruscus]|uniref:GLIPR1-like protein 1 n=1 Tax=Suncus etruscus TaxID=109475 RepID=UPI00211012AE|nr:GLIPR1-like protein 1 [Suncus etruscus]